MATTTLGIVKGAGTEAIQASKDEAASILNLHREIQDGSLTLLHRAKELGDRLVEKKQELGHGNWGPWLAHYLPEISDRHVRNYLSISERWEQLEKWIQAQQKSGEMSLRGALNYLTEASKADAGIPKNDEIVASWGQVGRVMKRGRAGFAIELTHDHVSNQFNYPKSVRTYEALWKLWEAEGADVLALHKIVEASEGFEIGDYVRGIDQEGDTRQGFVEKKGFKYLTLDIGVVLSESATKIDPPEIVNVPKKPDLSSVDKVEFGSEPKPLGDNSSPDETNEFRYQDIYGAVTRAQIEAFSKTYSSDTLANDKIRGMFEFEERYWVCTSGLATVSNPSLRAIGVVPANEWEGPVYDYNSQPPGIRFTYAGNLVKYRGKKYVLTDEALHLTIRPEDAIFLDVDDNALAVGDRVIWPDNDSIQGTIVKLDPSAIWLKQVVVQWDVDPEGHTTPCQGQSIRSLTDNPLPEPDNAPVDTVPTHVYDGSKHELMVGDHIVVIDFWEDGGEVVALDPELKMVEVAWDDQDSDREPWINSIDIYKPQTEAENGNGVSEMPPQLRQINHKLGSHPAATHDKDENCTPRWIWEPILARWGRNEFDIDVAASAAASVPAIACFTKEKSGLDDDVVWQVETTDEEAETLGWEHAPLSLNGLFSRKFAAQYDAGLLPSHFFVLTKSDSRTAWHQRYLNRCQAVCRVAQYITFDQTGGDCQDATYSVDVLYFGPDKERFAEATAHYGRVFFPTNIKAAYDLPPGTQVVEVEACEA